ncbi:MAG TPA: molybdopterin-dependent oxidoreductase, partial [Acidimicrobiales bacterium]
TVVDVEDNTVVRINGDQEHPLTRGFTCPKGRRYGALHSDPDRITTAQRRRSDGSHEPIAVATATEEIAACLSAIIAEHGPEAVGLFIGTAAYTATLTYTFGGAWHRATGSHKRYTTNTIDQTAKMIASGRMGSWAGGNQRFEDSDVWMLVGTNPPLSLQGATGFPIHDSLRRVDEARARGMKIIVVDPRRTEAATHADLHLQVKPGTDAVLFAGILNVVLGENLHDAEFCEQWVNGLAELRSEVAWATPEIVGRQCDLDPTLVAAAARMFANGGKGQARSGTGPDMASNCNAAEHLIQAVNVVCGRYGQAGDIPVASGTLSGPTKAVAMAISPTRFWERSFRMRTGVMGLGPELPSPAMIDDILAPGEEGKLRALVVCGGNPAAAFPGQDRVIEALNGLELLVTVDPVWSETAKLADYVIGPALGLERWDDTRGYESYITEYFAQVSAPVLEPPPGVVEDWHFYWDLAQAMGLTMTIGARVYAPDAARPSTLEMIEDLPNKGFVSYAEVREHIHGKVFDVEPDRIAPTPQGADGHFELVSADVPDDLRAAWADIAAAAERSSELPFLLIVRRNRDSMNTSGRRLPGARRSNPLFVHPDQLAELGIEAGSVVEVTSKHGRVRAVIEADPTMRRGDASMTHCYGGFPGEEDDPLVYGTNPSRLLSIDEDLQTISLMPHMSAVPISITAAPSPGPS